ncbi:MAG: hypothetical protein RQ715_02270 [Methylococcales bacterium]|nr:hypothetical protein [Methylococcales bacterium]
MNTTLLAGILALATASGTAHAQNDEAALIDVDQLRSLLPAQAGGPVSFTDGLLTVPRIDTPEQAGLFQDARLQFDPQTGQWRLLSFKTRPQKSFRVFSPENVELIVTETRPIQVFLRVRDDLSNGCQRLGQINQRLIDNRFEVVISYSSITQANPEVIACTQALVPFETVIALPVFGLPAGSYDYSVNGQPIGRFTLNEDNGL